MKQRVCNLILEFPGGTKKNKTKSEKSVYNAPPGFLIKNFLFKEISNIGRTSSNVDLIAAKSRFTSTTELQSSYNQAIEFAASLKLKEKNFLELKSKLYNAFSELQKESVELTASHQTISLSASIQGAGIFKGRTYFSGYIEVELCQIPFAIRDAANTLDHFKNRIKDFINSSTLSNSNENKRLPSLNRPFIQLGQEFFTVNKADKLVRMHWDNKWFIDTISEVEIFTGTLVYSNRIDSLFSLTKDNQILFVKKVKGQWKTGFVPTYGAPVVPTSIQKREDIDGIVAINEDGKMVITWQDQNGSLLPGGLRLSYSVIDETHNLF